MTTSLKRFHSVFQLILLFAICAGCAKPLRAQQAATAPPKSGSSGNSNAEFAAAADEVLEQMSEITGLKVRAPLKKTLRSRGEIHAYVIKQMDEDKDPAERYAGKRSAEAFGLIPKGFDLDGFMVDLLTEQIAGVYDPQTHEFYIADWIPLEEQRMVMAHELTHALEDQHFQIDAWEKAARPNDDAELAREAVLEGSATAAMIDYLLQGTGRSLKDLPEFDPSILVGELGDSPTLKKAPPFIKDTLIFPYFAGMTFSAAALKAGGWSGLPELFAKPPASTQQILHPELYRTGKVPSPVVLPSLEKTLGSDWKKLEENLLGEFGWQEVLKQYLGAERAKPLAEAWEGDRYSLYEQKQSKRLLLVVRVRLASEAVAVRFFGQYSEALEKKHQGRTNLFRRPNFFSFDTPDGGVFLKCQGAECLTLEGGDRGLFVKVNKELGWSEIPEVPKELLPKAEKTVTFVKWEQARTHTNNGFEIPSFELKGKLAKIFSVTDCEYISGLTCRIYYNGISSLPSEVFFTEFDERGHQAGPRIRLIYPKLNAGKTGRATFRIRLGRPTKIVLQGDWNGPWRDPY